MRIIDVPMLAYYVIEFWLPDRTCHSWRVNARPRKGSALDPVRPDRHFPPIGNLNTRERVLGSPFERFR